jgi:hypothetical protein
MDFKEIGFKGMDRIHWTQDRDKLQAPVNTEMNFWIPFKSGAFLLAEQLLTSLEETAPSRFFFSMAAKWNAY